MSAPWLCRVVGHRFLVRRVVEVNGTRWHQPSTIPLWTYCARCGATPGGPASDPVTTPPIGRSDA